MAKICYKEKTFHGSSLSLISKIDGVTEEYKEKGYSLTLRQCYYQLVARGIIENTAKSYKRIQNLMSEARLAGLIDWNAITDRTRNLRTFNTWENPADIIRSAAYSYKLDLWERQPCYIECWIEKDALIDIAGRACERTRTPFFSCRGFNSQSEMWAAAERFIDKGRNREACYIIHLGDHDPSGLDMTRDIQERLYMFGANVQVKRIALNMEQVEQYNPPPNFAKETDTRYKDYVKQYGGQSWELDAMRPEVIETLIHENIMGFLDETEFEKILTKEEAQRRELFAIADNYGAALYGTAQG